MAFKVIWERGEHIKEGIYMDGKRAYNRFWPSIPIIHLLVYKCTPFEQRYRKEKNRRNKRRNENDRKKEKNCKFGVFGRTSDFNVIIGGLDFNSLG